jgi:uncharacterized protein (TIGR02145 family)
MAENLKTTRYANGDVILNVTDDKERSSLTTGAWCYYDNDSKYNNTYGKLYNWYSVADSRNVCPNGWHVPSDNEWDLLINLFGGKDIAAKKLKNSLGWKNDGNGNNFSGFSAFPAGIRIQNIQFQKLDSPYVFRDLNEVGHWWSSTAFESLTICAWSRHMHYKFDLVFRNDITSFKSDGKSIRCIKY